MSNEYLQNGARATAVRRGLTKLFMEWAREAQAIPWPKSEKRINSTKGRFFLQKGKVYRFCNKVNSSEATLRRGGAEASQLHDFNNMLLLSNPIWNLPVVKLPELAANLSSNLYWSPAAKVIRPTSGFYRVVYDQLLYLGLTEDAGGRKISNRTAEIRNFMETRLREKNKIFEKLKFGSNGTTLQELGFGFEPNGTIRFHGPPPVLSARAQQLKEFVTYTVLSARKTYRVDFLVNGKVSRYCLSSEVDPATIFERTL